MNTNNAPGVAALGERSSFSLGIPQLLQVLKLSIWPAVAAALVLGAAAWYYLSVTPPSYSIVAEVVVERRELPTESGGGESSRFNATQAEILKSQRIINAALAREPLPPAQQQALLEGNSTPALWVLERFTAFPVFGTQVITAVYDTPDPEHGVAFLNAAMSEYLALVRESDVEQHQETLALLLQSEKELRDRLAELQSQYRAVSAESTGAGADADALTLQRQLAGSYNSQRLRTERELAALENRQSAIRRALSSDELLSLNEAFVQDGTGAAIQAAEVELATLLADYFEDHPDVRSARIRLAELEVRLRNEASEQLRLLQAETRAANRELEKLNSGFQEIIAGARGIDDLRLRRESIQTEIKSTGALLEEASGRINDSSLAIGSLAGGRSGTVASLIREPEVPQAPVWPRANIVYFLALALAAILGVLLGLLRFVLQPAAVVRSNAATRRSASELMREAAQRRVA